VLLITYLVEIYGKLTLTSMSGQIWGLPFQIYPTIVDMVKVNKWIVWLAITLQLSYPNRMPPLFYS